MSARLPLTVLGVAVDVDCVGPRADEAYAALAPRWSLCARTDPSPVGTRLEVALGQPAHSSTTRRVAGTDLAALMVGLTQSVTRTAIEANAGRLLMFHAAGLSNTRTGAAAVLVAAGGTGKTTACRTLGPGRGYLSDETVAVTGDDAILVYPKPLSVRRPGTDVKDEVAPTDAGLALPDAAPRVSAILVLARTDAWSGPPEVETLDPLHAITDLVTETSSLDLLLPRPLHRLHTLLERVTLLARVHYRDAATLEPLLRELIGAPDPRAVPVGPS